MKLRNRFYFLTNGLINNVNPVSYELRSTSNDSYNSGIDLTPINQNDDEWFVTKFPNMSDIRKKDLYSRYNKPHDGEFYVRLINHAFERRNIELMLSVYFHDILVRDKYKPTRLITHTLLKNLGFVGGYSYWSFKIVAAAADVGINPTHVTYALLFKNCAVEIENEASHISCGNKSYNLMTDDEKSKRMTPAIKCLNIWKHLNEINEPLNLPSTNSLINVLGKAKMLREAFTVLDNFISKGNKIDTLTLHCILNGCAQYQENGLSLALISLHKLWLSNQSQVVPDNYTLTLLFKIISNCQLGDENSIQILLNTINNSNPSQLPFSNLLADFQYSVAQPLTNSTAIINSANFPDTNLINEIANRIGTDIDMENLMDNIQSNDVFLDFYSPINLLDKNQEMADWTPHDLKNLFSKNKLAIFGGLIRIIDFLDKRRIKVNINTLTTLLRITPVYTHSQPIIYENNSYDIYSYFVIKLVKYHKLRSDTAFRNMLLDRQIIYYNFLKFQLHQNANTHLNTSFNWNASTYQSAINNPAPDNFLINFDMQRSDPKSWSILAKRCTTLSEYKEYCRLANEWNVVFTQDLFNQLMRASLSWYGKRDIFAHFRDWLSERPNMKLDRKIVFSFEMMIAKEQKRRIVKNFKFVATQSKKQDQFELFRVDYASFMENMTVNNVRVGDRKIEIDEIPEEYVPREGRVPQKKKWGLQKI